MKKLSLLLFLALFSCSAEKTAYIDINQVYASLTQSRVFREKLERLEQNYSELIQVNQEELAAYKNEILGKKSPSQQELQIVFKQQQKLDSLQKRLEGQFKDSTLFYNDLIEELVNEKVYEFGLKNGYQYIYSPASSNAFMYADSTLNVTAEVIEYINQLEP